ncbi:transporter substrate-binding domain-containing protein, partial [Fulvivirga sp. RKSG066]|uniref:ATP-binding protein n=1 Tax=Fulvivirga aurantia TaxID=2529383 RepID=UPI0012BC7E25
AFFCKAQGDDSWAAAKKNGRATLNCHWFDSKPFIYPKDGSVSGFEYDLLLEFQKFVKQQYGVTLKLTWHKCSSFKATYDTIHYMSAPNAVGASAFSITTERAQEVKFTQPYLPDISVIVSDYKIPIAYNEQDFDTIFNTLKAITIRQTTFEQHLSALKAERNLNFSVAYIPSSTDLIGTIANTKDAFGYIDLPSYLTALQDTINIKRQYLFSFRNKGIGFILPTNSDWEEPFQTFISDPNFAEMNELLIAKHFGPDVPFLINNIASGADISSKDEVLLLTKEKEIQAQELLESALTLQRNNLISTGFIIGFSILLVISAITYNQYRQKVKSNKLLSEQKDQIERQNERLIAINNEKNNLINILAHDLRSPINSINGLANLLELPGSEEEKQEYINQIKKSTDRTSNMISKILDVEAIESSTPQMKFDRVDMKSVLNNVVSEYTKTALAKNISLTTHTNGSDNYFVSGDEVYLFQVLENLISNALKFSNQHTKVDVSLSKDKGKVRIKVSDQGPGISKEDQAKLFNKFQRLSAKPTQGEQSIGLGLSIVKKYIELMHGSIYYESELGRGTDFIVEFSESELV